MNAKINSGQAFQWLILRTGGISMKLIQNFRQSPLRIKYDRDDIQKTVSVAIEMNLQRRARTRCHRGLQHFGIFIDYRIWHAN